MRLRKLFPVCAGAVLALALAANADATIVGSTYDFSASSSGATTISATNGTYTDPGNPGFCVGPPLSCGSGAGLSGGFSFSQVTPTEDKITFSFFGSTDAAAGSFTIALSNFATADGSTITAMNYLSNGLGGSTVVSNWNGSDATFTFSTGSAFQAIGGSSAVFTVNTASGVPEPTTLALLGSALLGVASLRRRKKA